MIKGRKDRRIYDLSSYLLNYSLLQLLPLLSQPPEHDPCRISFLKRINEGFAPGS